MTVVWERGLPSDGFFERRHDAGIISGEPVKRMMIVADTGLVCSAECWICAHCVCVVCKLKGDSPNVQGVYH